jgi:micrococcal nuclease
MKKTNKLGLALLVLSLAVLVLVARFHPEPARKPLEGDLLHVVVKKVIDGDTIVVAGGERVRYIGIDTPEVGEPLYKEAKHRNRALVAGKKVTIEVCTKERRDSYGRVLAWVYIDGMDAGGILLREGLAMTLTIPPCGLRKAKEFRRYQQEAIGKALGLWAKKRDG